MAVLKPQRPTFTGGRSSRGAKELGAASASPCAAGGYIQAETEAMNGSDDCNRIASQSVW